MFLPPSKEEGDISVQVKISQLPLLVLQLQLEKGMVFVCLALLEAELECFPWR